MSAFSFPMVDVSDVALGITKKDSQVRAIVPADHIWL